MFRKCSCLVDCLRSGAKVARFYLQYLEAETERLVNQEWDSIERVALDDLHARKDLTRDDMLALSPTSLAPVAKIRAAAS